MTKHTTGPWRVTSAPEGRWIEVVGQHPTKAGWEEDVAQADGIANAARIVACVNAFDGIDDPEAFMREVAALIEVAAGLSTLVDGWGGLSAHAGEINAVGSEATALLAKLPSPHPDDDRECPRCKKTKKVARFGYRNLRKPDGSQYRAVQSHCSDCRVCLLAIERRAKKAEREAAKT